MRWSCEGGLFEKGTLHHSMKAWLCSHCPRSFWLHQLACGLAWAMDEVGEKGDVREGQSGKDHDDPSEKMWSLYVAEAAKFDKALVESWKGDMEGILIFAGLFSASVTAFIVEGYKKLSADSGDMTVAILAQISSQLVAISNGTNLNIVSPYPPNVPFRPKTSVVGVNILWFLSLALGLVCAISATMVQQWARNYLQLVERHPAPRKRARIRAFLYEGIEKFRMTAVVEAIPTLLHVSLFFFMIGLVIFLFPINLCVSLIMLVVLTAVISLYATVTFLPMRHKNCPYQTPLSSTCWNVMQNFSPLRFANYNYHWDFHIRVSMAEARALAAMEPSLKRSQRDVTALDWMLESATDYSEMEQFFNAVPAFYRNSGRNAGNVLGALGSSLFNRSGPFLQECLLIHSPSRRRQAVACMTALQAVAPKLPEIPMSNFTLLWAKTLEALRKDSDATIATLAICTTATLASRFLFHIAEYLPSKSKAFDNDTADEQLLMKTSEQLPVDELVASMTVNEYFHLPSDASKPSADVMRDALRVLTHEDVMDASGRYLKRCRSSISPTIKVVIQTNPNPYDFEAEWLTRSRDWMNRSIIREGEIAVQHLRNLNQHSDDWSTHRAVWALSRMLRCLRTKKMREEFWNCGRLMIVNTLISQLVQCQHHTHEHSAFILETLRHLIGSGVSPNDADLETQTKFIQLVTDASSPSTSMTRLAFPVVEMLLKVFDEFNHPTSVALAINALEGNQFLLQNKFPLVERLNTKLSQEGETDTPHDRANTVENSPGSSVADVTVNV
ncbi:hypothetical protein BD410DRAFT_897171 [Rickenella mellea]|uniref:DUF6535 domain-containing protein n=1 Tax=Rickenella mellea TaxID=50990 RepID=A0A4Y7QAA1_9AGAM|nr:hypothetical protein BD410DRAFT_897171 [Rickenella mellea]